jgi:hypothetical protein
MDTSELTASWHQPWTSGESEGEILSIVGWLCRGSKPQIHTKDREQSQPAARDRESNRIIAFIAELDAILANGTAVGFVDASDGAAAVEVHAASALPDKAVGVRARQPQC